MKIPPIRLIFYWTLFSLLPLFGVITYFVKERTLWNERSLALESLTRTSAAYARKQGSNTLVRKKFNKYDALYLQHHLEPLLFLQKERRALEAFSHTMRYTGDPFLEQRRAFLKGETNRLIFEETGRVSEEGVMEISYDLAHPIELEGEELKQILDLLEQDHPTKPHLLIRHFDLHKKTQPSGGEVFELNLSLIQREYV